MGGNVARIRTIKPEFFRHEGLQDLEIANPGMYPMMVFEGLWGHCDSKGRFEWKPRLLKLDILPFLPFSMAETLEILHQSGFVTRYSIDGKEYGIVQTFEKHQRLTGKELQEGVKYPEPTRESLEKYRGSTGEIPESQEGKRKGREEEGKGLETSSLVVSELTPCPHQEIISLYAELLPELPQVRKWEGSRTTHLKARWSWVIKDLKSKGKPFDKDAGLDFFRRMFRYVSTRDFLMGRTGTWSASLPWIVEDENFTKIIEGNYVNQDEKAA
jgi:hypothetical protein